MMSVNTALRTKIMLRCIGVKLIQPQDIYAFIDYQILQFNRGNNRSAAPAHGAITTTGINQTLIKTHCEFHSTAMALPFMNWLNLNTINKRLFA